MNCQDILRPILLLKLLFFAVILSFGTATGAESEKTVVYFYSSETNINNFKSLKMEFDSFLSALGPYEFQPFSDRDAFEKHIKGKEKCLLLISSWHYNNISREYALEPVLAGMRNGTIYQTRVLVCKEGSEDMNIAKKGRIASASSIPHTQSTLKEIFNNDENAANAAKILIVPKDIDALMSVGFGMCQCALTTKSALDTLKTLNPGLYKSIKVMAEGKESLFLILASPKNFAKEAEKLITIIRKMPETPDGEKKIRMLGLDNWQQIDSSKLGG